MSPTFLYCQSIKYTAVSTGRHRKWRERSRTCCQFIGLVGGWWDWWKTEPHSLANRRACVSFVCFPRSSCKRVVFFYRGKETASRGDIKNFARRKTNDICLWCLLLFCVEFVRHWILCVSILPTVLPKEKSVLTNFCVRPKLVLLTGIKANSRRTGRRWKRSPQYFEFHFQGMGPSFL